MDYTISELPKELDDALRERARTEGKTLEQLALDALTAYAQLPIRLYQRDLSFMGDLSDADAQAISEAHELCDQIGLTMDTAK